MNMNMAIDMDLDTDRDTDTDYPVILVQRHTVGAQDLIPTITRE